MKILNLLVAESDAFAGVKHRLEAGWYLLAAFTIAVAGDSGWAVALLCWHIGMSAILRDRDDRAGAATRAQATANWKLGLKVRLAIADIHERQKFCGDRVRIERSWTQGEGADRVQVIVASAPERGSRL